MVKILNIDFQGPYSINEDFNDVPGIYVIYTSKVWLDAGETDQLGTRISNHDRKDQWIANSNKLPINLAFLYVADEQKRLSWESYLRTNLNPICGER